MKLITLVENTAGSVQTPSGGSFKAVHGLSFYVETARHRLLFDLGPDSTLFDNASELGIDLTKVDTVVLSHGHFDHGGALEAFLAVNSTAKVYVRESAFEPHYTKVGHMMIDIGLKKKLRTHPQLLLLRGDFRIDDELSLFSAKGEDPIGSDANKVLYERRSPDAFRHEQNLLIEETPSDGGQSRPVLLMGCGHAGVLNVLQSAEKRPVCCIGGFHVYNPVNRRTVPDAQLASLGDGLEAYRDVEFHTCHCTGPKAFELLHRRFGNVHYLASGDRLTL